MPDQKQLLKESEKCVIGSSIQNEDLRAELLNLIDPAQFITQQATAVWEAIQDMDREDEQIDLVRVSMRVKDVDCVNPEYTTECIEFEQITQNPVAQAKDIIEYDALGKIEQAGQRLYQSDNGDPQELTEKARKYFDRITEQLEDGEKDCEDARSLLGSALKQVEEGEDSGGYEMGLHDLDDKMGGVGPGECCIIAGRPSQGKTSLLRQVAFHISDEVPVAFFSVEMTAESLLEAYLISETGVSFESIRQGYSSAGDDEIIDVKRKFDKRDLYIDRCRSTDINHITNRMRVLHKTEGVQAVFVDYLQLLSSTEGDNRQQEVGKISRRLKQTAQNLDIALFAAAQLNRRVEHREIPRPKLSDLRDSGEIEQDADYVLLLYRPEYYGLEEAEEGHAEIMVAKQRMGERGKVDLTWKGDRMKFADYYPETANLA